VRRRSGCSVDNPSNIFDLYLTGLCGTSVYCQRVLRYITMVVCPQCRLYTLLKLNHFQSTQYINPESRSLSYCLPPVSHLAYRLNALAQCVVGKHVTRRPAPVNCVLSEVNVTYWRGGGGEVWGGDIFGVGGGEASQNIEAPFWFV